jgi:sensor histidine kinase regulating citrate/malate metabolism
MRFQTKLLLFLITETLVTTIVTLVLIEYFSYEIVLREMREKALSIAATTATQIDGDLHQLVTSRSDESSEAYKSIRRQLLSVRNINRREGTFVEYLYTIMPSTENNNLLVFGIDPEVCYFL